jgi:hypothetical protein
VHIDPAVSFESLLTTGDPVGTKSDGVTPWRMVGIPDGLGAFDNGDGTFTVLMNHELLATEGVVRDHGFAGAFVSRLVIDSTALQVLHASDQIQNFHLQGLPGETANFARFCSADQPILRLFRFARVKSPDKDTTEEAKNAPEEAKNAPEEAKKNGDKQRRIGNLV